MIVVKRPKLNFLQRIYIGAIFKGLLITLRHAILNLIQRWARRHEDNDR